MSRPSGSLAGRVRILEAAATLFAGADYGAVSMADLGKAAGMGASTIYWHFPSKQQILTDLFDECLDHLLSDQEIAIQEAPSDQEALVALVARHADFVVFERATAQTYYRQSGHVDTLSTDRLRRKQRTYIARWAAVTRSVHAGIDQDEAERLVRAAIGAMQSDLFNRSPWPDAKRHGWLTRMAVRLLAPVD